MEIKDFENEKTQNSTSTVKFVASGPFQNHAASCRVSYATKMMSQILYSVYDIDPDDGLYYLLTPEHIKNKEKMGGIIHTGLTGYESVSVIGKITNPK
jgi:hypothetical protein